MAKVPLRTYLKEIKSAINEQQIDEVVAHCRHILQFYPKHTETYKLLGKAYLEAQRYGNAVDIFQRVLSSIPDDFLSHVGMSIIREDESNLDTALWHMERAFEVQPYNPAIRDELRRLYGKRDGMQPPKARLTPGALARLYAKGGHLQQAISELNTTLAQQPKRADLLVLLAKAYAQSGNHVQAIRISSLLLQDLPYCLEANRLLAKLLKGTEREEDRARSHQRLQELDPYEAHISPQAPSAEEVPAQAIMLERLDWDGSPASKDTQQPKWASSLEIDLGKSDSSENNLPDWLDNSSGDSAAPSFGAQAVPTEAGDIPAWMREAGWEDSTGQGEEGILDFDFDEDELDTDARELGPAVAASNIPAWMQSMAPENTKIGDTDEVEAIFDNAGIGDTKLDWAQDTDDKMPAEETLLPAANNDLPDWLQGLGPDIGTGESASAEEGDLDWLQELSSPPTSESAGQPALLPETENIPDWLQGMDDSADDESDAGDTALKWLQNAPDSASEEAQPAAQAEELSDWLAALGDSSAQDSAASIPAQAIFSEPAIIMPETTSPPKAETEPQQTQKEQAFGNDDFPVDIDDPDAAMAWLEGLAANQGAPEEELVSSPADRQDALSQEPAKSPVDTNELPDWLQNVQEDQPKKETTKPVTPDFAEQVAEDDTPDWLQNIADEEILEESAPQAEAIDIPEWLQTLADETPAQGAADTSAAATAEVEPEKPEQPATVAESAEAPMDLDDPDATMAWLESLAVKQGVPEEELVTSPEAREAAPSVWVQDQAQAADTVIPAEQDLKAEETASTEEVFPEWLAAPDKTAALQASAEDQPDDEASDFPEWLTAPAAQATSEPEPEEPSGPEPMPIASLDDDDDAVAWLTDVNNKGKERSSVESVPPETPEEAQTYAEIDIPEWLQDDSTPETQPESVERMEAPDTQVEEAAADESAPVDEDLPDWLKKDLAQQAAQTTSPSQAETDADQSPPAWISEESQPPEDQADQDYTWVSPDGQETDSAELVEKLDLNKASLVQLERLPGLGFRSAQSIVVYRAAQGPFTRMEDLLQIEGMEPGLIASLRDYLDIEAAAASSKAAPPVQVEAEDQHHAKQLEAQHHLSQGNIDEAMQHYSQLIKKGKRIDEAIKDLEAASYQHPVDALVMQTLGDAHMRADNLQEALRIYTKAEQLLRS